MAWVYKCEECGNNDEETIEFLGHEVYMCKKCGSKNAKAIYIQPLYERRRAAVYATGNKWAIENWNATH